MSLPKRKIKNHTDHRQKKKDQNPAEPLVRLLAAEKHEQNDEEQIAHVQQ